MLTERGVSFGYNNLVVDMRSFPIMHEFGVPVVFDVTHSLQLPGGLGHATGGQSEYIEPLARAGVACGVDAVFMEVHECPERAPSDGPNALPLERMESLLLMLRDIHKLVRNAEQRRRDRKEGRRCDDVLPCQYALAAPNDRIESKFHFHEATSR